MDGQGLRDQYSDGRIRLARVIHCHGPDDWVTLTSPDEMRAAYESRAGVIWVHWDASAIGAKPGAVEAKRVRDAKFIEQFLRDAFGPEPGEAVEQIIRWRLNIVGGGGQGGVSGFEDEEDAGAICMFDSEVFAINYTIPNELRVEEMLKILREAWRRALLVTHRIAGIAVPGLVVTVRNDGNPTYFDQAVAESDREEEDESDLLSPDWLWSGPSFEKALRRQATASLPALRSGDFLSVLARECVESYEGSRSWLLAEAEEVEVARFAPELAVHAVDEAAFAHRHAWLLQQASRVRAALDWGRADRDLPNELFGEPLLLQEVEARRRALLAELTSVRSTLRSSLDLVATSVTAEQLRLSRLEAARSASVQSAITFVTAVLLAPGLVAAVFGAMPAVLQGHPVSRFLVILVSMALAGVLSLSVLRVIGGPGGGQDTTES